MKEREVLAVKYRYRRRGRRTNRGVLALLLFLTAVFLVSCVAGSNPLWVRSVFGLDTVNYESEPAVQTLTPDGETANSMCDIVEILLAGNLDLATFHSTAQVVRYYRDEILNSMLCENYSLYVGNGSLVAAASEKYPHMQLCTLIPGDDFENTVFRYFGGTSVSHGDGEVFSYLSRADAYTAPVQPRESDLRLEVVRAEETEHTYRLVFTLTDGVEASRVYTAVFIKRENGSFYL